MKRVLLLVLCAMLALPVLSFADQDILETMAGLEWDFCSGAGGWSTDMRIQPDGSFSGEYHDSDMGDVADAYPGGIVYFCSFSGRLSLVEQVDDYTWRIRVDKLDTEEAAETIEDGVRYIPTGVYGLSEGDVMVLYRPGTPVSFLSEDMQFWAHVLEQENTTEELENWFLSSEENSSGFVGYQPVSIANPWEDVSADQLMAETGISFGVPEGAENVIYRFLRSDWLAEMQFTIGRDEFCARIKPEKLGDGQLLDISGMYFEWEHVEEVRIGQWYGTVSQAQTGSEDWVELCQWYDDDQCRMYTMSVYTTDPDGMDLTALADQVYIR